MEEQAVNTPAERGHRRRLVGVVTSDKMDKTVVVVVTRKVRNPRFGKFELKRAKDRLHIVEGASHNVMLEKPDEVAEQIGCFLA